MPIAHGFKGKAALRWDLVNEPLSVSSSAGSEKLLSVNDPWRSLSPTASDAGFTSPAKKLSPIAIELPAIPI
jgi:hypothetical protein